MCGQRLYGPSGPNGKRPKRRRYSLIYSESYSGCQSTPGKSNELTGHMPKRVNFIQIQQAHTIQTEGYRRPYLGTGYESVIAQRTSEMFAYSAKQDGKVISITDKGILIEYADGTQKGVKLGRQYGKAEGSVYPHDITTQLKPGQKFSKGSIVAYNTGFFEPDYYNPGNVVMKNSATVKVALFESNKTHEDASSISTRLGDLLSTKSTKVKSIVIDFAQNVHDVVKVGQAVGPKDILMIIEDEITASTGAFDADSLALLRNVSSQAPKSKYKGTIDHIEIYYNGDKEDMTPSLRQLVNASDNFIKQRCQSTGEPVITGRVTSDYRVNGVPLILDKAEIKIFITVPNGTGVGDKVVYASQMKSVVGETMSKPMITESGIEIDAIFGFRSIMARIVTSPIVIGTTITCVKKMTENAIKLYRGK